MKETNKKINAYVCQRLHTTVTEDLVPGVTPMLIECPHCLGGYNKAQSMGYRVDQTLTPTHEWYKPTDEDWKTLEADISSGNAIGWLKEHTGKGGLLFRAKKDYMPTGVELIAAERREQIEKHSRTLKHDLQCNNDGQLADAAYELLRVEYYDKGIADCPNGWDEEVWQRIVSKPLYERLIISGALIAAELDRMQNNPF